jgi:hypothetical protein
MSGARHRPARSAAVRNTRLLRAWGQWHRQQLDAVLAGPHGAAVAQVIKFLKGMGPQSAPALIALLHEHNWSQMEADVRLVVLHEINTAITKLRERNGLAPINDALPDQPLTAFQIIRSIITSFPLHCGEASRERFSVKQSVDKRSKQYE